MCNFKIGDVVERLDADFLRSVGPGPHVVTGVGFYGWLQVNHWRDRSGNEYPWYSKYFTLVDGGDDELPPAPESVQYREDASPVNTTSTLLAQPSLKEIGSVLLEVKAVDLRDGHFAHTGIRLSANETLQLCHDLRRMAMEIKRKEKQND